jgi:hypothetical protein
MSYTEDYELMTGDPGFKGRVSMCIAEQAKVFVNDDRPEFKVPASRAIADNAMITAQFLPLVATQPGMTPESTDGDLIAAVQYLWPIVGATHVP